MPTITIAAHKGGPGKTTVTANTAAALGETRRVLAVDFDPQGDLTDAFGIEATDDHSIGEWLLRGGQGDLTDVIVATPCHGVDILPAVYGSLAAAENRLATEPGREQFLRKALAPLVSAYDIILIDTPPRLGVLLDNALVAADSYVIVAVPEPFALKGMVNLRTHVGLMEERGCGPGAFLGVLLNAYESRTRQSREVLSNLEEDAAVRLFPVLPRTVRASEAEWDSRPAVHLFADSPFAQAIRAFADELVLRMETIR